MCYPAYAGAQYSVSRFVPLAAGFARKNECQRILNNLNPAISGSQRAQRVNLIVRLTVGEQLRAQLIF